MQTTNQANQAEVEAKLETGRHHFVLIFSFTVFYSRITQAPSTASYLSETKFDNVISISSNFNPSDFNLPDADCWDPTYSFTWTYGTRIHIKEQPTTWNEEKGQPLFTLLKESKNKACIIFTTMKEFNTNVNAEQQKNTKLTIGQLEKLHVERQQKLQEWFPNTPAVFWSKTCVEHNGFFGSHTSTSPTSSSTDQTANAAAADHQQAVSTYFRLIVKTLLSAKAQDQDFASTTSNAASYSWDEMSFLSSSFDTKSLLLCFDVPADSITSLYQTLPKASDQIMGPLALHIPVLEELVRLYDLSVWAMANKVRGIEKQRLFESGRRTSTISSLSSNSDPLPNEARTFENFEYLFEISRHLAHSVETTQIAAEIVERLKDTCDSLRTLVKNDSTILLTRVQRLSFLHSLLRGLSARAISNEKRLTSEQVLLSNTISQRDSKVNKEMSNFSSQIALATREDGAAMKTIAVVTLTFLPATFVTI
ncbi:hypothetical protein KCV07_g9469, partial [Aureobasidium melanogenum]